MTFALPTLPRLGARAACLLAAAALAACGGGDDAPAPAGTSAGASVAAAPLVASAGTPAALNGTLGVAAAQYESGSSNETMTTFASSDPYCRVAAYTLTNSVDGQKYYVEVSFRKDTRAVGLVKFGRDATMAVLATLAAPAAGVTVDVAQRRIGFSNAVLGGAAGGVTLNGSIDYPTNFMAAARAACG